MELLGHGFCNHPDTILPLMILIVGITAIAYWKNISVFYLAGGALWIYLGTCISEPVFIIATWGIAIFMFYTAFFGSKY